MGIFDKRENYKPFEYPEIMQFVDSMNKSFWVHSEVEFTADIQDFKESFAGNSTSGGFCEDFLGRPLRPFPEARV